MGRRDGDAVALTVVQRVRALTRQRWLLVAGTGTILAAVAVFAVLTDAVREHDGISTGDPSRLQFFVDHRTPVTVDMARIATEFGAAAILALLAVGVAAVLLWRRKPLAVALAPAIAFALAGGVASATKSIVGRTRPPVDLHLVGETSASFPSGHSTDSTAFYVAVALVLAMYVVRRPLARVGVVVAGAAVAVMVGLSRLVLGVHWPTDVAAGWALGTASAVLVVMTIGAMTRPTGALDDDAPSDGDDDDGDGAIAPEVIEGARR